MATLSMAERRSLKPEDFVFPEKAPGPGSYPIENVDHAEAALMLSRGKPEEGEVRRAVCARYKIGCAGTDAEDRRDGGRDEASEKS